MHVYIYIYPHCLYILYHTVYRFCRHVVCSCLFYAHICFARYTHVHMVDIGVGMDRYINGMRIWFMVYLCTLYTPYMYTVYRCMCTDTMYPDTMCPDTMYTHTVHAPGLCTSTLCTQTLCTHMYIYIYTHIYIYIYVQRSVYTGL